MKNDKLFAMGTSFDERSDEEEAAAMELNVPVRRNNSASKNLTVESIPLVSKWSDNNFADISTINKGIYNIL